MAFSELPEELNVTWQKIIFRNYEGIESKSGTNYAFCKVRAQFSSFSNNKKSSKQNGIIRELKHPR